MATAKKETPATAAEAPASAANTANTVSVYVVLDTLRHNGTRYGKGESIELTPAQAHALPAGIVALAKAED